MIIIIIIYCNLHIINFNLYCIIQWDLYFQDHPLSIVHKDQLSYKDHY